MVRYGLDGEIYRETLTATERNNTIFKIKREGDTTMSLLIKDTTKEEREEIVAKSIGNISGACDGCSVGIIEMYQDYIDGKKELRQINMEFHAGYISEGRR